MGYDMYVVDADGERVDCPDNYWRRSIGSGGRQASIISDLGLGGWADSDLFNAAEAAEWPEQPDTVRYDEELEKYVGPGVGEWHDALHARLKDRRGAGPGIAVYKLCNSNDGWWVTREECQEFLDMWETIGRPEVDDFGSGPYGDTIPFIRAAAEHHGFRVW